MDLEDRLKIVRQIYESRSYRVHSGIQFGCELVLYADDPRKVHSDFCVHVVPEGACPPLKFLAVMKSLTRMTLGSYAVRLQVK
jgi:tRNA splicing endonuclease